LKRGATPSRKASPFWPVPSTALGGFAETSWDSIFAAIDPYRDDWRSALLAEATVFANRQWLRLSKNHPPGTPAHVIARHTWVAMKRAGEEQYPVLTLTLMLAAKNEPRIEEVVNALRQEHNGADQLERWHWIKVIMGEGATRADGDGIGGISPKQSLRFALAHEFGSHASDSGHVLKLVSRYTNVSRRDIAVLLGELITKRVVSPLAAQHLSKLPTRIQLLFLEHPELKPGLLGVDKSFSVPELEGCKVRWAEQRVIRRKCRAFLTQIRRRQFDQADVVASQILAMRWESEALINIKDEVTRALMAPQVPPWGGSDEWLADFKDAGEVLRRLAPSSKAAILLCRAPADILNSAIGSRRFRIVENLANHDMARLRKLWSAVDNSLLINSGRLDLLSPDLEVESKADIASLLRHLKQARAREIILEAARSSHDEFLLASIDSHPSLADLLRGAAPKDEDIFRLLVRRLDDAVIVSLLPPKVLGKTGKLEIAIRYWRDQQPSRVSENILKRFADALATRGLRSRAPVIGEILDLSSSAPTILIERLGIESFAKCLPSLDRRHRYYASAAEAMVIARGIMTGVLGGSPETVWAVIQDSPELIPVITRNPVPQLDRRSGLAEVAIVILTDHKPQRLLEIRETVERDVFVAAAKAVMRLLPGNSPATALIDFAASLPAIDLMLLTRAFGELRFGAGPGQKLDHCYRTYPLPKKAGGKRRITVPPIWLRRLQRQVYNAVLRPLEAHAAVHGFVPQRSIVTNAQPHVNRAVVVNCDIANCFPSVTRSLVFAALKRDLNDCLRVESIRWLTDIVCFQGALPVGAPTSPALLNRVLLRTDEYLTTQASKRGAAYTRYADDLTFSGDDKVVGLLRVAASTLSRIGLSLDEKKTNIYRSGRRQLVTGLVVNKRISVPRRLRRRLRAAVHAYELGKAPTWRGRPASESQLRGWMAFSRNVNPEEIQRLLERLNAVAKK